MSKKNENKTKSGEEDQDQDPSKVVQIKFKMSLLDKQNLDTYMKAKGKINRSALIREALNDYMHFINPLAAEDSFHRHLQNIETKLDTLEKNLEQEISKRALFETQLQHAKHESDILTEGDHALKERFTLLDPKHIEHYENIKKAILHLLTEMPGHTMKEFLLMSLLRKENYDERDIWLTLTRLELENIISFDKTKGEIMLLNL